MIQCRNGIKTRLSGEAEPLYKDGAGGQKEKCLPPPAFRGQCQRGIARAIDLNSPGSRSLTSLPSALIRNRQARS